MSSAVQNAFCQIQYISPHCVQGLGSVCGLRKSPVLLRRPCSDFLGKSEEVVAPLGNSLGNNNGKECFLFSYSLDLCSLILWLKP